MAARKPDSKTQTLPFDLALLTEALDYELLPHVVALGGDVWLDAVLSDRVVIGFRHPGGEPGALRSWLRAALVRLLDGNESAFDLYEQDAPPRAG